MIWGKPWALKVMTIAISTLLKIKVYLEMTEATQDDHLLDKWSQTDSVNV